MEVLICRSYFGSQRGNEGEGFWSSGPGFTGRILTMASLSDGICTYGNDVALKHREGLGDALLPPPSCLLSPLRIFPGSCRM